MVVTKYYCDKCKKEVPKSEDLDNITIESPYYGMSAFRNQTRKQFNLCVSCRDKLGMIKKIVKDDKIVLEPTNVKDRLYDIVCELVQEVVQ